MVEDGDNMSYLDYDLKPNVNIVPVEMSVGCDLLHCEILTILEH